MFDTKSQFDCWNNENVFLKGKIVENRPRDVPHQSKRISLFYFYDHLSSSVAALVKFLLRFVFVSFFVFIFFSFRFRFVFLSKTKTIVSLTFVFVFVSQFFKFRNKMDTPWFIFFRYWLLAFLSGCSNGEICLFYSTVLRFISKFFFV